LTAKKSFITSIPEGEVAEQENVYELRRQPRKVRTPIAGDDDDHDDDNDGGQEGRLQRRAELEKLRRKEKGRIHLES